MFSRPIPAMFYNAINLINAVLLTAVKKHVLSSKLFGKWIWSVQYWMCELSIDCKIITSWHPVTMTMKYWNPGTFKDVLHHIPKLSRTYSAFKNFPGPGRCVFSSSFKEVWLPDNRNCMCVSENKSYVRRHRTKGRVNRWKIQHCSQTLYLQQQIKHKLNNGNTWLRGGAMVKALDLWLTGRGLDSRSVRLSCNIVVLSLPKSSTSFGWGLGGTVISAGFILTLNH